MLCAKIGLNWYSGSEDEDFFLISSMYLRYFLISFPWKMTGSFIEFEFEFELEFPLSKDARRYKSKILPIGHKTPKDGSSTIMILHSDIYWGRATIP